MLSGNLILTGDYYFVGKSSVSWTGFKVDRPAGEKETFCDAFYAVGLRAILTMDAV